MNLRRVHIGKGHAAVVRRGFTMIEIMVVVAIIVILASITVGIGVGIKGNAQIKNTKATLTVLENAMSLYLKDNPEPSVDVTDTEWVNQLLAVPGLKTEMNNLKVVKDPANSAKKRVLDGWGNPIFYIRANAATGAPMPSPPGGSLLAGLDKKPAGYFWSFGPDGLSDTNGTTVNAKDDVFSNAVTPAP